MRRQIVYTRRYIPTPIRIFFWVIVVGIVIQSFIHTLTVFHYMQTRSRNVHTRRSAR